MLFALAAVQAQQGAGSGSSDGPRDRDRPRGERDLPRDRDVPRTERDRPTERERPQRQVELQKNWIGEFRWDKAANVQRYEIALTEIKREKDQIAARGCARVTVQGKEPSAVDIRMVVNERTLDVEIWETNPSSSTMVTDGTHKGRLSSDLRSMETEWRTRDTGERGRMRLRVGGNLTCAFRSI
jgi:hypothetical protein